MNKKVEVLAPQDLSGRKPESSYRKLRNHLSSTKARIPLVWLKHKAFRPEDIFLGAYPRSGSTWSRFILFQILTGQEAGFDAVNKALCGVSSFHRGISALPGNGRLIGTHEVYRPEYKRAIYLVRDVRDVLLSEYSYNKSLGYFDADLDQFVMDFSHGKVNGFGPWHRNVISWLDSPIAHTSNLLVVKFEDLRRNTEDVCTHITQFLGLNVDRHEIRKAVAANSLAKMREKENESPQLPPGKDRFVRNGSVQGWLGKLTAAQLEIIEYYSGDALLRLGYPLSKLIAEKSPGCAVGL